jgi:hypothetical protein
LDSNVGEVVPAGGVFAGRFPREQPAPSAISAAEPRVIPTHVMDRFIESPPELVPRRGAVRVPTPSCVCGARAVLVRRLGSLAGDPALLPRGPRSSDEPVWQIACGAPGDMAV